MDVRTRYRILIPTRERLFGSARDVLSCLSGNGPINPLRVSLSISYQRPVP